MLYNNSFNVQIPDSEEMQVDPAEENIIVNEVTKEDLTIYRKSIQMQYRFAVNFGTLNIYILYITSCVLNFHFAP